MAADNIQFRLHFITDESEALANTHKKIKELNGSIYEQENSIKKLETEYQKLEKITDRTAEDEAKMVKIKDDIVEKNKKIAESIREIAVSSKDISKLDLSKVTQSQLTSIAKQIDLQRKFLAQSSDEYQTLTANLKLVNDQLAKVNASTRGVAVAATTAKVDSFFKDAFSVFLGGGLLQAVTAVGSAILSFGKSSISAAADMETLGVSLEVILGSADKAKEALDFAKGYASSTPFELPGINEAILKLSSYGFELEDIKKELPKIGDIASGVGVPIEELAAIFGKAKLSNFIQAEELNQLADRGIPVFESLARQMGVSTSEIKKMGSDGKITFDNLKVAFGDLTKDGGAFFNLTQKQSQTATGLWSTFKDAVSETGRNFGTALLPAAKGVLNLLIPAFDSLNKLLAPVFAFLGEKLVSAFKFLQVATAPWLQSVKNLWNAFSGITGAGEIFDTILQAIGASISVVSNVAAYFINHIAKIIVNVRELIIHFPILGKIIGTVKDSLFLGVKAITYFLAALNGMIELGKTAYENVAAGVEIMVLSFEFGIAKMKSFLSKDQVEVANAAKAKLDVAYSKLGKSMGDAFTKGYNDALGQFGSVAKEEQKKGKGLVKEKDPDAPKGDPKEAEKLRKKQFDTELSDLEAQRAKKEVILEGARFTNKVSEQEYQSGLFHIEQEYGFAKLQIIKKYGEDKQKNYYDTQKSLTQAQEKFVKEEQKQEKEHQDKLLQDKLASIQIEESTENESKRDALLREQDFYIAKINVFAQYGKLQEKEAVELKKKLADVQKKLVGTDSNDIDVAVGVEEANFQAEEARLINRFSRALLTEQAFQLQKLELRKFALENEIAILSEGDEKQIALAKKKEEELLRTEEEITKKKIENIKREQELKQKINEAASQTAVDFFQVSIDLLSKDEAARKKNANAVKAFEAGKITVNYITELSNIAKHSADLGPVAGPIVSFINAAIATAKFGIGLRTINEQKFAKGGMTGNGYFSDDTGFRVAGVVHQDEWVAPKWQVEHPQFGPVIKYLESGRVKGFAEGGFTNYVANTTIPQTPIVTQVSNNDELLNITQRLLTGIENMPTNLRAHIVYGEYEDTAREIQSIQSKAAA